MDIPKKRPCVKKKQIITLLFALLLYFPFYMPLAKYMGNLPLSERLGYLPTQEMLKISSIEHKFLISKLIFFKSMFYFGGRINPISKSVSYQIDYDTLHKFLNTSVYLDPYNMDTYYFAQAVLTWDAGMIKEVNEMLKIGKKHRYWDHYFPYFLGFNYSYFLKDYKSASAYFIDAAKITKDPLFANLAARYMYEANQTEAAIVFLKKMHEEIFNQSIKLNLEKRIKVLEAVLLIENKIVEFRNKFKRNPKKINEIVEAGLLNKIPDDPYDGKFYIDEKGIVRTTSKFSSATGKK